MLTVKMVWKHVVISVKNVFDVSNMAEIALKSHLKDGKHKKFNGKKLRKVSS